ncbi:hypothetical protein ACFL6Y_03290 [Elusimicrobiota bacterium]
MNNLKRITVFLPAMLLLLCPACKNLPTRSDVISGKILLSKDDLLGRRAKPNTVCYLIVKDKWKVPIVIKRWINPGFPFSFVVTKKDRLLASRPWHGPFFLEAYYFGTKRIKKELPPPANATKAHLAKEVYPGDTSLILKLMKANSN